MSRIIVCSLLIVSMATLTCDTLHAYNSTPADTIKFAAMTSDPAIGSLITDEIITMIPDLPNAMRTEYPQIINNAALYFPASRGMRLEYAYTSSEFPGTKIIILNIEDTFDEGTNVSARIKMLIRHNGRTFSKSYTVTRTASGVFSSDSVTGGKRQEFAVPITPGRRWKEGTAVSRIASLKGVIAVPAGNYRNCLKVVTKLSGGDGGSAIRYYAPKVGLVFDDYLGEERQDHLRLISFKK